MFVVVVDIVVVASYASHNKQLVSSGSDIRIGCSVLVAASKGFYTDDKILKAFYANGWEQARNMVSRSQHSS